MSLMAWSRPSFSFPDRSPKLMKTAGLLRSRTDSSIWRAKQHRNGSGRCAELRGVSGDQKGAVRFVELTEIHQTRRQRRGAPVTRFAMAAVSRVGVFADWGRGRRGAPFYGAGDVGEGLGLRRAEAVSSTDVDAVRIRRGRC